MAQIVICDIDGTLAQTTSGRVLLLQQGKWEQFAQGVSQDKPIRRMRQLLQMLYVRGFQIHLHTGRGEACREATEEWLWNYSIPFQVLLMRGQEDLRPDYVLKWDFLRKNNYNPNQVFCIFEDRTRVVDLYRQLGYFCLQVDRNVGVDQKTTGNIAALQDLSTRAPHLASAFK